jgi:hypothetical protein
MSDFDFGPSQADVEAMQTELAQRRLADWQREAVTAHPGAAPFADLLVASDRDGVMELAADIANRHQPQQQTAQPQRQAPGASVPAGSPSLEGYGESVGDDEYRAEMQRLRTEPGRSWATLLNMKFSRPDPRFPD